MNHKPKYAGLGIALGAGLGAVAGVMAGNMGVWLAIGVAIGLVHRALVPPQVDGVPAVRSIHREHDLRSRANSQVG